MRCARKHIGNKSSVFFLAIVGGGDYNRGMEQDLNPTQHPTTVEIMSPEFTTRIKDCFASAVEKAVHSHWEAGRPVYEYGGDLMIHQVMPDGSSIPVESIAAVPGEIMSLWGPKQDVIEPSDYQI